VEMETPAGAMRARARLNDTLDPRVVVGEHGWWQDCEELGVSGYDPFSRRGANFNGTVDATIRDPVSGTPSHRANLCEVRLVATGPYISPGSQARPRHECLVLPMIERKLYCAPNVLERFA
jgi:molydopterin dinucleotide binding protein